MERDLCLNLTVAATLQSMVASKHQGASAANHQNNTSLHSYQKKMQLIKGL